MVTNKTTANNPVAKHSSSPKKAEKTSTPKSAVAERPESADEIAHKPKNPAKSNEKLANEAVITAKPKKYKLIRDSYTIPENEHKLLQQLKERCLANGKSLKKSELLRAGILKLVELKDSDFLKAIARVEIIKTGRPGKSK